MDSVKDLSNKVNAGVNYKTIKNEKEISGKEEKKEVVKDVAKDEVKLSKESSDSKEKFILIDAYTGLPLSSYDSWKGGLLRTIHLAYKVAGFPARLLGLVGFLSALGAIAYLPENLEKALDSIRSSNVHKKVDGFIDIASIVAWGAGMTGAMSAPIALAIAAGLYGAKIINHFAVK